jgi:hypothetical protein
MKKIENHCTLLSRWILASPSNHQRGPRPLPQPSCPGGSWTSPSNHQRGPRPLPIPSCPGGSWTSTSNHQRELRPLPTPSCPGGSWPPPPITRGAPPPSFPLYTRPGHWRVSPLRSSQQGWIWSGYLQPAQHQPYASG